MKAAPTPQRIVKQLRTMLTTNAMNRLRFVCVVFACLVPVSARAQCISMKFDVRKALHANDWVFAGTLLRSERDEILTFRVEKVWKGPSNWREIVVHQLGAPSVHRTFYFQEGTDYLIFARTLDQRLGPAYGFDRGCGDAPPWPLSLSIELDKLANARRPKSD